MNEKIDKKGIAMITAKKEEKPKEPTQLELDLKPKLNVIKNEDKESD